MESDHQQQQGSAVASQEPLGSTVDRRPANDSANRVGSDLEQKRDELAHSLAMLRATLDATTDGILVTDSQRRVTAFNQQYCRMWNVPRSVLEQGDHNPALQLVARSFGDPEAFLRGIDRIYDEAPPDTFDIQYLKDGRIFERSTRLQCVEGKSVGRVWCFRDVTEHRRSTEALREETRILDLLNKTGSTIAADLDLDTLVQSVTDLATQISGAKFGAFFYNSFDRNGESYVLYTLSGADRSAFEHFGHP
ncbi:MAG: PAS-domain containing protein, partial [Tepidisphaeraceae bacterium]